MLKNCVYLDLCYCLSLTGAMDPRCKLCIFMGKTDPGARTYSQQSMILVPMDTPGINIVRPLSVYGYEDSPSKLFEPANFCDFVIYLTPKPWAAILKILSVQNFVLLHGDLNGILGSKYVSMSSKTTPFFVEWFSFDKYACWAH